MRDQRSRHYKIESSNRVSVFFISKQCFRFEKILTGCRFYAQLHVIVFIFSSMLTIAWTTACTVVLMIIFSSIPVHVNRNVTMALNKVNYFLWVKVPFRLSAQSFDFWTFCKMTSLRVSFIIGFSAREAFPGC